MRDHGGNLDWAMARWGGSREEWVDLSTGINPRAYPMPDIPPRAWADLPTASAKQALNDVAREAYGAAEAILAVAGAQAAIQMIPRTADFQAAIALDTGRFPARLVRVLGPTYNEHAASFEAAGWGVQTVGEVSDLAGAAVAVVVNPNNPDGRVVSREALRDLAGSVGSLIVDESFADPHPAMSMASEARGNVVVLRSFGKFYGLAGLRLGFVLASDRVIRALSGEAGPWPVSGAAMVAGQEALADRAWQEETVARLKLDCARLDGLARSAGWSIVGGSELFRLYQTGDATAAQELLAEGRVWSRIFPYSKRWIRLGLPDGAAAWAQVAAAF